MVFNLRNLLQCMVSLNQTNASNSIKVLYYL